MKKRQKAGLLGGSFDPIHFGHINLAFSLLEARGLDEVFFCPTSLSPFKQEHPPQASAAHRLNMVERAIADIPQFSLLNTEINRQGVSFTIDTVRALLKQYPDIELHLLLGGDHLDHFHEWKEADQLIALAPPLVGMRKQHSLLNAPLVPELLKGKVEIPLFDISSTEVRKRLIQKKYCSHLVPPLVLDYIAEHSLYSSVHEKQ